MIYSIGLCFTWYILYYINFSEHYNAVNYWLSEIMEGREGEVGSE
jgi:hypothetical protein